MGMFDSVMFECPDCGNQIEVQSKAGACNLHSYGSYEVPAAIAVDINGETVTCHDSWRNEQKGCGKTWKVVSEQPITRYSMKLVKPCTCTCQECHE